MNAWFSDYLLLALRLDRHIPGIVDAYYGPPDMKARAEAEGPESSIAHLAHETARLLAELSGLPISRARKDYLSGQLRAITLLVRKAGGEAIPFGEEVLGCFQVLPGRTPETTFREAARVLDAVLPGRGAVRDRMIAWSAGLELAEDRVQPAIRLLERDLRHRTRALLPLPAGESVEFCTVINRPWGGYNWYLGGCRSRVEINTDLPVKAHGLPALIAHEAYPGHHTEHAIKDALLWQAESYPEFTVLLANTPDCLVSEGLANLGLDLLVPEAERADWLAEEYLPLVGFGKAVATEMVAVSGASRDLRAVAGNAAFMLHEDGCPVDEARQYVCEYALKTSEEAAKLVSFLSDPLWRTYIFTYYYGEDLLRAWLDRVGWVSGFRRLVTEPLVPEKLMQGAYG
jgi:hypothetical protein